jgi:hypothetical protein
MVVRGLARNPPCIMIKSKSGDAFEGFKDFGE